MFGWEFCTNISHSLILTVKIYKGELFVCFNKKFYKLSTENHPKIPIGSITSACENSMNTLKKSKQ